MIDDESEPGSWKDALFWRQQLDHALWRGPKIGASKSHESINMILEERGNRYGSFVDQAALSQGLKHAMACDGWNRLSWDQKEALEMICHKMARILNGDPNYAHSWVDIAGYAKLVADRLERGNA